MYVRTLHFLSYKPAFFVLFKKIGINIKTNFGANVEKFKQIGRDKPSSITDKYLNTF